MYKVGAVVWFYFGLLGTHPMPYAVSNTNHMGVLTFDFGTAWTTESIPTYSMANIILDNLSSITLGGIVADGPYTYLPQFNGVSVANSKMYFLMSSRSEFSTDTTLSDLLGQILNELIWWRSAYVGHWVHVQSWIDIYYRLYYKSNPWAVTFS
jgi:hypothetical protein